MVADPSARRTPTARAGRRPAPEARFEATVAQSVQEFGQAVTSKLRGNKGSKEDHLRSPLEVLLTRIARDGLGLHVVPYGEEHFPDLGVRPDYVVEVGGAQVGCVEVKAPIKGVIPTAWSPKSHDRQQWEKLRRLPNVLYSCGEQWALYRSGELFGNIARLEPALDRAGNRLRPADGEFARVITDFLLWAPERPRTIQQMVRAVAGLCRLLRDEVLDVLSREKSGRGPKLFVRLAWEWRELLFPSLSDTDFADAYAQTVTFALLLARVEGIAFEGRAAPEIARQLAKRHSLMGKALSILTEDSIEGRSFVLSTLMRVIGAVDWDTFGAGAPGEAYAYLYERFLEVYDPDLRKQSGSYYTPAEVVAFMVSFVEQILRSRKMSRPRGFASDDVVVVDPAMGTGSFLDEIVRTAAGTFERIEGPGQVAPRLREMISRLIGFEKQAAPFAVAELRLHRTLKLDFHAEVPKDEPRFLTDTLSDPYTENPHLWTAYEPLQRNLEEANRIKRDVRVMVVIGNPPYKDKAGGEGGWIEKGGTGAKGALLDSFRSPSKGRYEYLLSSLSVYFWRWATWKVFEAHPEQRAAIVAFISTAAYTGSHGFEGMRRYLRSEADEGWIIDLSPEGHRPPVGTRVFRGVAQPLCIGIFVRYGSPHRDLPATIHHMVVSGSREKKFRDLARLRVGGREWTECPDSWGAPFTPKANASWYDHCSLSDLMPWSSRGVTPGRTWVYAPERETLTARWQFFLSAETKERRELFKEARDRKIDTIVDPLPGVAPHKGSLADERGGHLAPVRVAYRSFDRQWLIPDNRLMVVPRPALWTVRSDSQIFLTEQNARPIEQGPGLTFASAIPDMNHYNGRGGCVRPLYRTKDGDTANVAPGVLRYLSGRLRCRVEPADLLAYIAGIVAHPGYTALFKEELKNPGIRVPLTTNAKLWSRTVEIGREVLWLHTYGERYVDPAAGRPPEPPRMSPTQEPKVTVTIPYGAEEMPETIFYDEETATLHVGAGEIFPVAPAVWSYQVAGMRVVEKWFGYRRRQPAGRRSSALDDIHAESWTATTSKELLDLLNVLGRCVALEPSQEQILSSVCSGDLITVTELEEARVLPVPGHVRKPLLLGAEDRLSLF